MPTVAESTTCTAPHSTFTTTFTTQTGKLSPPVGLVASAQGHVAPAPSPLSAPHPPGPLVRYLSLEGLARSQGTLRSLAGSFAGVPGVISLSAGFPPPTLFPFSSFSLRLQGSTEDTHLDTATVLNAQQYNSSLRGQPSLLSWAINHVAALHAPPAAHQVLITNGANHALELITSLFLDRGDTLLVEEYTYPVITESICGPKGIQPLAVPIDENGIIPAGLRNVLQRAQTQQKQQSLTIESDTTSNKSRPKMLYTVPTGHNPTGCSVTPERRLEIYQICREYDVWILEDDPYFYLQWDSELISQLMERMQQSSSSPSSSLSNFEGVEAAVPGLTGLFASSSSSQPQSQPSLPHSSTIPSHPRSYVAIDVDQRVIRVDTFSKFLAPGLRLGWVTARQDVIDKLTFAIHAHTVGPCGVSQATVGAALSTWGDAGLDAHLRKVQGEYAKRCAVVAAAARRHLTGLAEWRVPRAGMFLWLKLIGIEDASDVWESLKEAKVIVCPGRAMHAGVVNDHSVTSPCVRLAFSCASIEDLEEGVKRLGKVLRDRLTVSSE